MPPPLMSYSRVLAHTLTPGGATAAMVLSSFEHVSSRLALSCVAPSSGADVPCTAGSGTPHRDPPVVAQHIAPLHGEHQQSQPRINVLDHWIELHQERCPREAKVIKRQTVLLKVRHEGEAIET